MVTTTGTEEFTEEKEVKKNAKFRNPDFQVRFMKKSYKSDDKR